MDKATLRDYKKAIRGLKKVLRQYERGSDKWKEIREQIRQIEVKMSTSNATVICDEEHLQLLNKVIEYYNKNKLYISPQIDLKSYTKQQLEFHYLKLIGSVKTKNDYYKLKNIEQPTKEEVKSEQRTVRRSQL